MLGWLFVHIQVIFFPDFTCRNKINSSSSSSMKRRLIALILGPCIGTGMTLHNTVTWCIYHSDTAQDKNLDTPQHAKLGQCQYHPTCTL